MSTIGQALKRVRLGRRRSPMAKDLAALPGAAETPPVDIAPNDPVLAYLQSATGTVDVDSLELDSPGVRALKDAGVKLVVPLVSQGELIGLLNLGPRLSQQEYSADDRKLLADLAVQAAPAMRVGQLVREQQAEAAERERIEQELKIAQLIQQQFLPKELPELSGWKISAYYRPAREVGGDFYDFIELPGGKVGVVVGDVTDKGVPAALVMATTRSMLRTTAAGEPSPGEVLRAVNEMLVPDIPAQMFVTCLYGVLDPSTGHFRYANAGHNVPYLALGSEVAELKARGMPLGLMPGMTYEEKEATIEPGQMIVLHSDGIAEAHNAEREMFSFERLKDCLRRLGAERDVIDEVLTDVDRFRGHATEQEDDITLVALTRSFSTAHVGEEGLLEYRVLAEFTIPSVPGSERAASERVAEVVAELGIDGLDAERLKTAVAEATMNAIEHGNKEQPDLDVHIRIVVSEEDLAILITDQGGGGPLPEPETPDIEAKLTGLQKPRGWGLFLIQHMVDDVRVHTDESHHTIELVVRLKGRTDG